MKALIVGYGEIGHAIGKLIEEAAQSFEITDPIQGLSPKTDEYEVMHICFPFQDNTQFLKGILAYIHDKVKLIFIHSTVAIGTCEFLQRFFIPSFIHSPLRGTHPDLLTGIKKYINFLGSANYGIDKKAAESYLDSIHFQYEWAESSFETELGKLVNTTWYGLQIAFANQIDIICRSKEINFDQAYTRWMETDMIGRKYEKIDGRAVAHDSISRPTMIPGHIGGHCVMPNLKLLEIYTPELAWWIHKMQRD